MNTKKGFTLIELLIVIAIVGILAVAFVPTLLDAPARGRDSQRVANLTTIRTVLLDAELRGVALPDSVCTNGDNAFADLLEGFGGRVPQDPQAETRGADDGISIGDDINGCTSYIYLRGPGAGYSFGLYAKMENNGAGNASCAALTANATNLAAGDKDCYAILVQ